jgi:transcriptional regulator with XRE-family HTH domain
MARKKSKRVSLSAFPLKEMLKRFGWSQYKLAKASGIHVGYVSRIHGGHILPGWKTILRIATTIGADLGDFTPGRKASEPESETPRRVASLA